MTGETPEKDPLPSDLKKRKKPKKRESPEAPRKKSKIRKGVTPRATGKNEKRRSRLVRPSPSSSFSLYHTYIFMRLESSCDSISYFGF